MLYAVALIAVDPPAQPEGPPWYSPVFMMLAIFVLGYLLLWRPAQRQEAQRRETLTKLKKNDRVVNSGGIIGIIDVIKEKEDEVVLKGGLHITKSSIVRVLTEEQT